MLGCLVLSQDNAIRLRLGEMLASMNVTTALTSQCAEAEAVLAEAPRLYHLLIIAVGPQSSGDWQLAKKQSQWSLCLPVLAITAESLTADWFATCGVGVLPNLVVAATADNSVIRDAIEACFSEVTIPTSPQGGKPPAVANNDLSGRRILIVDDSQLIRDTLVAFATKLELIPYCAQDGHQGIEQIKLLAPDLIIMDINMPLMDGFTSLARLKESNKTKAIPVFAMSSPDRQDECLANGFDGFFVKPISFKVFKETMIRIIANQLSA